MSDPHSTQPLHSLLENDPDMAELIDLYISDLDSRIKSLEDAWSTRKYEQLCRIAHQLRGASAGYGFPTIGQVAGKLEDSIRHAAPGQMDVTSLQRQLSQLIGLCHRAMGGRS